MGLVVSGLVARKQWHPARIARRVANSMNDDLGFRGLVENQIGIRRRGHAPDGRIIRAGADAGV